ncbi:hypothetical protein BOSE62_40662 [Bosea sp. 62]|nr:hypothetical protein BOSE46_120119 [Bosea sp. 46]CAD5259471.1 hypothetical protein BOSE21B_110333 [Bosea sp. 21B]CAD5281235.1 hypothetical protein BOSE7B_40881 [Bosea sp. 7B]VVT58037.1 hypothetical protein BOS5A_200385 [Bosea sp. EC-HK365B]VXB45549.1 hypothetical protein BOSE29B_110285 [Bosea sp. 29B]VXB88978.1 hypothetical protein BOSE125_160074 [Bosea sp. 125]VXC52106.1 hypothetical protein BOSE62_40662 [Bosea sp. 62]VXC85974.1 hypothetical protein BOSE127_60279 [Bosea sp. 127]
MILFPLLSIQPRSVASQSRASDRNGVLFCETLLPCRKRVNAQFSRTRQQERLAPDFNQKRISAEARAGIEPMKKYHLMHCNNLAIFTLRCKPQLRTRNRRQATRGRFATPQAS